MIVHYEWFLNSLDTCWTGSSSHRTHPSVDRSWGPQQFGWPCGSFGSADDQRCRGAKTRCDSLLWWPSNGWLMRTGDAPLMLGGGYDRNHWFCWFSGRFTGNLLILVGISFIFLLFSRFCAFFVREDQHVSALVFDWVFDLDWRIPRSICAVISHRAPLTTFFGVRLE